MINICKLLVVDSNVLDDGGLDQPADGVVVAEVVPAVVFHEPRAGDQFVEGPSGLDWNKRIVPTVHHERRHRQLLEALLDCWLRCLPERPMADLDPVEGGHLREFRCGLVHCEALL